MKNSGVFTDKWNQLFARKKPEKTPSIAKIAAPKQAESAHAAAEEAAPGKFKRVMSVVWRILFALRKVVLALPVVYAALRLAAHNRENLPVLVGIDLQSSGEFAQMISRDTAVNVPLMITFGCLALMFFSRKTVYPWLISIFTLVLPVLLYLTNGYLG